MNDHVVARQRASLLERIHRRYQTRTETVRIKGLEFPFTRIANPDLVLDQVAEEEDQREKSSGVRSEDPLHLPYWAELWDSASGLAQYLAAGDINESTRVLDLGCGMGLSGTTAAALGARVMFADLESPALLFARLNSLASASRVRTRRLDWRRDLLGEKFDLILGADIVYERSQWEFLNPFWREHLADGGAVVVAEPGRQSGDAFIPWIKQRKWQVEEFSEAVVTREKGIRILRMRVG